MRTLSATALAKLRTRLGNEPVVIIEIQWIKDGGWQSYADRDITTEVKGKILELSDLDNVIAITENNDSQEISVTFDDTDGTLKDIIDQYDIHMRDVRVWQWFEGLSLSDKFLLFCGKINSPIIWNEGEQTLSFSIVSRIEDKEFGFSPEEGQFPYIPVDLIGIPWPSCFGTPLDVPCVRIGQAVHGTTLAGLGILSGSGEPSATGPIDLSGLAVQQVQAEHCSLVASCWAGVNDNEEQKYLDQTNSIYASLAKAAATARDAASTQASSDAAKIGRILASNLGINPVRILGGELFPRGTITLDIDGGLFTGHFGTNIGIDDDLFTIISRTHPENLAAYYDEVADPSRVTPGNPGSGSGSEFNFYSRVPCGRGNFNDACNIRTEGIVTTNMLFGGGTTGVLPKYFWADAGSSVSLYGTEPITYIVSIVPGTVLSVKAYKTFNGVRHLINIPDNYYRVETKFYGPIEAVQIVLNKTLSTIPDQNWSDDVYVTFESSVGPNIVDILEYIIDLYTDFTIDTTSFDAVRARLEPFPANFAVLDRKNVLTILQEIAFQARCSLRLINGVFYLTYLPAEPVSIDTIVESDVEVNSITISGTPTEDIVTKLILEWRISYANDKLNKLILRHNVGYYGLHEETIEFYIYNQPDIVLKVGTFWLIRKANTWKYFNFRTFLHKLNIETLDCVTLDFEKPYASNSSTKAIVQKATFNSTDQLVDMECWLPIKFGTMDPYDFAWPADVSADWIFPTDEDVYRERSGGKGIGEDALGVLPIGDIEDTSTNIRQQFKSGGAQSSSKGSPYLGRLMSNRTYEVYDATTSAAMKAQAEAETAAIKTQASGSWYRERHDTGDRFPTDQGFIAQPIETTNRSGEIVSTSKIEPSNLPLTPNPQVIIPTPIPLPGEGLILDLSLTKVRDYNRNNEALAYLKDILHFNADGDKLCLCSNLQVWDASESDPEAEFDFRYDSEGNKWGAGTAWLK